MDTDIESKEIVASMAHKEHHFLAAARRNITVEQTYWQ
jgi:hypothetical protein